MLSQAAVTRKAREPFSAHTVLGLGIPLAAGMAFVEDAEEGAGTSLVAHRLFNPYRPSLLASDQNPSVGAMRLLRLDPNEKLSTAFPVGGL